MISAHDVLHAISEIHQYSMLLIELKNSTTVIVLHHSDGTMSYYKFGGSLKSSERATLTRNISKGSGPANLKSLTIAELIDEMDGQRAKHIWLEAVGEQRREYGFLSISELQVFLRMNQQRQ